jgi:hypothetical protein
MIPTYVSYIDFIRLEISQYLKITCHKLIIIKIYILLIHIGSVAVLNFFTLFLLLKYFILAEILNFCWKAFDRLKLLKTALNFLIWTRSVEKFYLNNTYIIPYFGENITCLLRSLPHKNINTFLDLSFTWDIKWSERFVHVSRT